MARALGAVTRGTPGTRGTRRVRRRRRTRSADTDTDTDTWHRHRHRHHRRQRQRQRQRHRQRHGGRPQPHRFRRRPTVTELIRSVNGPVTTSPSPRTGPGSPGRTRASDARCAGSRWPGSTGQNGQSAQEGPLVVDVTDGRFEDENPVFTRDGRYLAFLSWRGFDPVYDVHTGDLSFPAGLPPLPGTAVLRDPSSFALNPEGRPAAGGLDPLEDEPGEGGAVTVEVEGLANPGHPVPGHRVQVLGRCTRSRAAAWSGCAGPSPARSARPSPNRQTRAGGPPSSTSTSPRRRSPNWSTTSTGSGSAATAPAWSCSTRGDLRAVPATEMGDGDSTTWIDLRRILHEVDPAAEWRQAYDEAGRLIRAYFLGPRHVRHRLGRGAGPVPAAARTGRLPDEFADLLREVLGELGTSHAVRRRRPAQRGSSPLPALAGPARRQLRVPGRLLGGQAHPLPGDSSDSKARSPLAGTGIREGRR